MRAGTLDRRVTLLQPVPVRNAIGEETTSWQTVGQAWASVEAMPGGEGFDADRREHKRSVRITIRYRPGVRATWRVQHDGDVYEVTDVQEPERRETLVLLAFAREPVAGPGGG